MDGPRVLEVWAHIPLEVSSDYGRLDEILHFVSVALVALEQTPGTDGFTVSQIIEHGKSADFYDLVYNTISRNASFGVLSHESTASELSLLETP